jgi:hypothetical protein
MGEVGEDGWQFFTLGPDLDVEKIAQSEELIFETIASMIDTDITFNKLVWASDYRYLRVSFSVHQSEFKSIFFRPNIRMVNRFSEGPL